jgi:hypothetical protein
MLLQVLTADGTRRLSVSMQDPNAWDNLAVDVFDKLGLPAFASPGQAPGNGRRGSSSSSTSRRRRRIVVDASPGRDATDMTGRIQGCEQSSQTAQHPRSLWNFAGDGEEEEEEEEEDEDEDEEKEGEDEEDDQEKMGTREFCGQDIMRDDTMERISRHLTPRSLQRLSCTCTHLRLFCSMDEAWMPWLKRLVASPGRNGTTGESAK